MRVLILSQWYRPEPDLKIHLLARDLVRRGHEVTVITGVPNYPTGKPYPGYRLLFWPKTEWMDGVRVVRVPLYPDHSGSALKRVLNYVSFAVSAALFGPFYSRPADVMWVYHPPLTTGIPAVILALVRKVPFVYEVQDMWPETLTATGMLTNPSALAAVGAVANTVYARATRLAVISPGFKSNLMSKGVAEGKIQVIPNWADEDIYRPVVKDPELARQMGMSERFNILYAGNLGAAQALENVLEAAARLSDLPQVQFVVAGDGVEEGKLRRRADELRLGNVRFVGRVAPERVAALCALSDVLLVHLRQDPLFEITIPSKTIAYLACGRPILTVSRGDPADVVVDAKAGRACPPGDPARLAAAIRDMCALNREALDTMAHNARAYYEAHFTRAKLMDRYEALLLEMSRGSAS